METVFSLARVRPYASPVATIGVFDGVHTGHRKILSATAEWAREIDGTAIAITFDRHPERILKGNPPESITSLEHKLHLIADTDIDVCVVLHFDQNMAQMRAERFVREILVEALAVKAVVLGHNARFGSGGTGDADLLARLGAKYGFCVRTVSPLEIDGAPVSSTRIRRLIESGELDAAARLLGRPFTLRGTVVHGAKRGRDLAFPTANLNLHHEATPPSGVYIARASLRRRKYWALANIGTRPTFSSCRTGNKHVEVHLEDYEGAECYGETMEVKLVRLLRGEEQFESPEVLVAQIRRDMRSLEAFRREIESGSKSA